MRVVMRWMVAAAILLTGTALAQDEEGGASSGAAEGAPEAGRPELPGGIYDKPYIRSYGRHIAIGGYMDMEFIRKDDGKSTFDQHRFIPFIYAEVSDRIRVSAEIEFEHGGFVSGSKETEGEIKLEYAIMDFEIAEPLVYRGGVILSPLGAFNLLHDSPLNDLTSRPIVSRQIVPTTLSESGMGLHGQLYPTELSVLSYEIYMVNGFNQGILKTLSVTDSTDAVQLRIRGGRGSQKSDNNEDKAVVGRIGLSPLLGLQVGASVHSGLYDDANLHRLTIVDIDARINTGPLELHAEVARAHAELPEDLTDTAQNQLGGYGQVNFHLFHDLFLPGAVFTLAARVDYVDFDTDREGDVVRGGVLGVNFRPVEDTVFKLDQQWTESSPPDGTLGDPETTTTFSFATYF